MDWTAATVRPSAIVTLGSRAKSAADRSPSRATTVAGSTGPVWNAATSHRRRTERIILSWMLMVSPQPLTHQRPPCRRPPLRTDTKHLVALFVLLASVGGCISRFGRQEAFVARFKSFAGPRSPAERIDVNPRDTPIYGED